jgi:hypothetical protein
MALQFTKDIIIDASDAAGTSICAYWYALKVALLAAGWTCPRSSDGLAAYTAGDHITGYVAGASGSINNNNAWFEIANGSVSLVIQMNNLVTRRTHRIKAARTPFTGGAPGILVTPDAPTASDEMYLSGGGTSAAPTYGNAFASAGIFRVFIAADNASPRGFIAIGWASGGAAPTLSMFCDPMAALSYDAADTCQYMLKAGFPQLNGAMTMVLNSATTTCPFGFLKNGAAWAGVTIPMMDYKDGSASAVGSSGANAASGKDQSAPLLYARRSALGAPAGVKGISTLLKVAMTPRTTGDTLTYSTAKDHIYIGDFITSWDGTVPTL